MVGRYTASCCCVVVKLVLNIVINPRSLSCQLARRRRRNLTIMLIHCGPPDSDSNSIKNTAMHISTSTSQSEQRTMWHWQLEDGRWFFLTSCESESKYFHLQPLRQPVSCLFDRPPIVRKKRKTKSPQFTKKIRSIIFFVASSSV